MSKEVVLQLIHSLFEQPVPDLKYNLQLFLSEIN